MVLGFGRGKKEPEGVGCYGKLPGFGDYISHLCEGSEASKLTSWLDEGYRITGGKDDLEALETRFLLPGRGKHVLFGAFWPSGDSSGTRRFPFSMFAGVAAKRLTPLKAHIPLVLAPVWDDMLGTMPDVRENGQPDAVQGCLATIQIPDFPSPGDAKEQFGRAAAMTSVSADAWDVLFDVVRLTSAIAPGSRGDIPAFAIRLAMRTGCQAEVEACLWLTLLADGLGESSLPGMVHVFFRPTRDDRPGEMFVFHRTLKPEDLGFILSPTEDYPYANTLGNSGDLPEAAEFRNWCESNLGAAPTVKDVLAADFSGALP